MKPRTLLVLGALALLMGAFILFFEKDLPSTDERLERSKRVLGLKVEDISGLTLDVSGQEPVRFERREENPEDAQAADDPTRPVEWHLMEPLAARADAMAVADLLRQLTELEHRRKLDDLDTASAGLDDPTAKVTFMTEDGPIVLRIGAEVPASTDRIVAVDGQTGAQVAAVDMLHVIERSAGAWRDKNLVSGLRSEVQEVVLESARGRMVMASKGDELWLGEPWNDRADNERTESLLGALLGLRAENFVEGSPLSDGGLGLDPPQTRIELGFADGRRVEVLLGDPLVPTLDAMSLDAGATESAGADIVHARVDGELVTVRSGVLNELAALEVDAWRSTAWSHLEVFQIEAADVTVAGGPSFTVKRQDGSWSRNDEVIDYDAVSDLLYGLVESRAVEVMSRQEAISRGIDLEDSQWTVQLLTTEGEETLQLWGPIDEGYAVGTGDRPVVLLLEESTVTELRDGIDAVAAAQAPSGAELDAEISEE